MPRVVGARGNRAATRARTRERVAARGESPRATIARAIRARRRAETRRASRRAAVRASPSAAPRNVVVRARCDGFDFARRRRRRKRARGDARERASERAGRGERARTCRVRRQPKGLRVRVCVCVERDGACAQLSRLEERFAPPAAKSTAQDAFRQSFPADRRLARRGRISGLVRGTSVRYSVLRRVYSPLTPKSRSNENHNETAREPKKFAAENGSGKSSASIEVPPSFDLKSPLPVPFRAAFAPSAPGHPRRPFLWRTRAEPRRERVARRRGGVGAAAAAANLPEGLPKTGSYSIFHPPPPTATPPVHGDSPRRARRRGAPARASRVDATDERATKRRLNFQNVQGPPRELSSRPRDLGPVGGVGAAAAAARVIAVAAAAAAARPSVRRRRRRPRAPTASASHEPRPRAFLRRLQRVHHEQKEARA